MVDKCGGSSGMAAESSANEGKDQTEREDQKECAVVENEGSEDSEAESSGWSVVRNQPADPADHASKSLPGIRPHALCLLAACVLLISVAYGCRRDCAGDWSEWSECSISCGGGDQTSLFTVQQTSRFHGGECRYYHNEERKKPCNTQPCPRDCKLGHWQKGDCSAHCGGGTRNNTRSLDSESEFGGYCPPPYSAERFKEEPCNTRPCPDELVEALGSALSDTVQFRDETHRQTSMLQKMTHHLLNHIPPVTCSASIRSQHAKALETCQQHNKIAEQAPKLALLLDEGYDACEDAAASVKVSVDALNHHLPILFSQTCRGEVEGANSTLSDVLMPLINSTLIHLDKCRSPYRTFAKGLMNLKPQLLGLWQDPRERADFLHHEMEKATGRKDQLSSDLSELAQELADISKRKSQALQEVQKHEAELQQLRKNQGRHVQERMEKAQAAGDRARQQRAHASNLDESAQGKSRHQSFINNLNIELRKAKDFEERSSDLQQSFEVAQREYRDALAEKERALQRAEDRVKSHEKEYQQKQGSQTKAEEHKQEADKILEILYEIKRNENVRSLSEGLSLDSVNEATASWRSSVTRIKANLDLDGVQSYMNAIQGEVSRAGEQACERARQHVKSIFKSAIGNKSAVNKNEADVTG
ncbi:unnamed protein product [Effrenium voratum]|nr:unnamed protein product [Effrenium voratum]